MLSAVQIFNNPKSQFKSESFIVLSNIAWTYLLHAFFKEKSIEYRHFTQQGKRKKFEKTKKGAYRHWGLEKCLNHSQCPVDRVVKDNLMFLIGLRHEIEHQMTTKIDDYLSARLQACCLNYNKSIKTLFGKRWGIDKYLSFSLQFSSMKEEHANQLQKFTDLPKNISSYINDFDSNIPNDEYNDRRYSYRILYTQKSVNHKGQADKVIEFIPANSPEAKILNTGHVLIKEKEKEKYLPGQIVELMRDEGYSKFNIAKHTKIWQSKQAKDINKNFGTRVCGKWYWYDIWLNEVENHCRNNAIEYGKNT